MRASSLLHWQEESCGTEVQFCRTHRCDAAPTACVASSALYFTSGMITLQLTAQQRKQSKITVQAAIRHSWRAYAVTPGSSCWRHQRSASRRTPPVPPQDRATRRRTAGAVGAGNLRAGAEEDRHTRGMWARAEASGSCGVWHSFPCFASFVRARLHKPPSCPAPPCIAHLSGGRRRAWGARRRRRQPRHGAARRRGLGRLE